MITAKAVLGIHGYRLEFVGPEPIKPVESVRSQIEAKRIVYFKLRVYILSKLIKWLHQRQKFFTLYLCNGAAEKVEAIQLMELGLTQLQHASIPQICAYIARNESKLRLLEPRKTGAHYKHFHDVILPIIRFSTGQENLEN